MYRKIEKFYKTVKGATLTPELERQCMEMWNDTKVQMDKYFNEAQNMSQTKNDDTRKWMDELLYDYVWKYVVLEGR